MIALLASPGVTAFTGKPNFIFLLADDWVRWILLMPHSCPNWHPAVGFLGGRLMQWPLSAGLS